LTKVALIATIATLALAGVAFAHTLGYRPAHKLAVKLGKKQTRDPNHPVKRWRIFGAERTSPHQIVWVYNVDYSDGTLCDAELVVRLKNDRKQTARAFFRDVHCER
jgi:hypothetical protein